MCCTFVLHGLGLNKGKAQMIPFSTQAAQAISKIGYEDGHILNAKLVPKSCRKYGHLECKTCTRNT